MSSPPGETIEDLLEERQWCISQFANMAELGPDEARGLLQGTARITPEIARRLENIFGSTAHFWLTRQRQYDETLERQRRGLFILNRWVVAILGIIIVLIWAIVMSSYAVPDQRILKEAATQYARDLQLGEILGIATVGVDVDRDGFVDVVLRTREQYYVGPETMRQEDVNHHLQCGYGKWIFPFERLNGCRIARIRESEEQWQ